jgi:hypothetical protein
MGVIGRANGAVYDQICNQTRAREYSPDPLLLEPLLLHCLIYRGQRDDSRFVMPCITSYGEESDTKQKMARSNARINPLSKKETTKEGGAFVSSQSGGRGICTNVWVTSAPLTNLSSPSNLRSLNLGSNSSLNEVFEATAVIPGCFRSAFPIYCQMFDSWGNNTGGR